MTLLFCFLVVAATCLNDNTTIEAYRYNNGELATDKLKLHNISGSVYRMVNRNGVYLPILGLDLKSITPFLITSYYSSRAEGIEETLQCEIVAFDPYKNIKLGGLLNFKGNSETTNIIGNCTMKNIPLKFTSTNHKSDTIWYPPKEAGKRAKNLLGISSQKIYAPNVILYAISDFALNEDYCKFLHKEDFKNATELAPGVIIVGKDDKHCAILDDEGDKFIHSNPIKKKVTIDSIAQLGRYFPNGYDLKLPDSPYSLTKKFFK